MDSWAKAGTMARVRRRLLPLVLGALLAGCQARGTQAPGWVTVDAHVRYQARRLDDHRLQVTVAYLHTTDWSDDRGFVPEAREAFAQVALDLHTPRYDPQALTITTQTTANGVREVTVSGVTSR